ncbi:serine/arginine repetitive matrix protein 2 [Acanthochromis polyacanthus]|uniref:serine/arginine repetitive matrix protein 2 n=1 Tax=Acanthochromis polyacanthus TaxID=80966 RepID=UPI00223416E6|nr:serine/arginine repetitive matrix protein 2 [Acanthochromis polyacanthus]
MDSWTLQGDSYSFLRSAPRTFSLCHRDGTPNHVEIFDIINVPTQRSAISETTCLCDIFGDDGESPSLSSSPAVGAFVPSQREVEGTAAASPPVDDLNDSSGSYHTAHGSSEGEEGFEDSGERVYSPPLQKSAFESRTILSSPLHSPSGTESLSQSRETPISPELSSSFTNTQASSPFSELRGRVSLPDLFSRGSTPEITDCTDTPELILDLSTAGRDTATTPESQDTRLSLELDSAVSSPAPRYTPPSPVISTAASPELVDSTGSPELRNTAPSPGLLSAVSPARTGSRTPSPDPSAKIRRNSTFSEPKSQVPSPVVTYSLSPSPGIRDNDSPIEHRYTAPSPEIRIIASSPEVSRKEQSSEVETTSASPFLEPHFEPASSRSLASSPHITDISYSVVQPEDRNSPPFPELSRLSSPEPDRTRISSEARGLTPSRESAQSSITESTGTPRDSPHIPGFANSVPESELTHQARYQTPSPQSNHHSPSPEPRYQSPSPDRYQSPSPQHRSRDLSPVASVPEQRYQHSPATLCTEYNPQYTQSAPPERNTPEVERDSCSVDIAVAPSPTHLSKDGVSPSFELDRKDKSLVAEIKSISPVVSGHSPVSTSPVVTEEKVDSSVKHQSTEREETPKEVNLQHKSSVVSFSDESQDITTSFCQREDSYNNPATETKSLSPNLIVYKDKSPNISPVNRATSNSPVQRLQNPQPQFTSYSLAPESSSSLKSTCTPVNSRRQLLNKVRGKNRERFKEDMSRRVHRRRTPSPPLTRFTPVHIIAPEKPYRQWQNRSQSPSQVVASSLGGNLKHAVTNRESHDVAPVDSNSQAHWVRQGRQLEMEREMQLEQEREVGRGRQMDREVEKERKREEQERGEGWQGDASYRGEQVELSFSARNRKGPASRSAAPTSRETSQGLPTVHSYSESLLTTRQLQQQQSLLRLASQQEARGGSAGRRLQPPVPHKKSSAPGRVASNRPGRSSSSSMGSELDEADNEVKWFTDLAFRSLSSPEVDYLDMYNSSHRSSTNISQPSTQESPAGINAAWLAYADFRGSAPKLDHDDLSFQHPYAYCSDGLDPSRRYELGSFECVDVAVEREDSRKVRKGVPKRQIQLKRKSNTEGKQDESSENSSPGLPAMGESPSQESPSRGTFLRQHSTPAAMQDCYPSERSPEPNQQNDRKSKLQKSASMDETCTKTKMATCLIKSVLSKKMQGADKQPDEQTGEEARPSFEDNSPPAESAVTPRKESPKPDVHSLSTSLQSDYSLSSEGLSVRGEASTKDEAKPPKSFGARSGNRPGSSSSSRSVNFSLTDSEEADSQSRTATSLKSEMKSELKVPFDSKQTGAWRVDESKTHEREAGDSSNATAGNTGAPSATGANNTQIRMTNRDQECENTEDHKQVQHGDKGAYMSKTPEITLKAVEKKKASINVCLTPEAENKPEASSPEMSLRVKEKIETNVAEKTEEEGNENNKVKAPIHKVRDVRRLVKNKYNLSFKAASAVMSSHVNEERMDSFNKERREEVLTGEERDVRHEIRREGKREEREEEFWVDRKEEQKEETKDSKMQTLTPPLQSKGKSPPVPQPMQIEYKAICWKEDKNKLSGVKKDSEKPGDKPEAHSKPVNEPSRDSLGVNTANSTKGETVTVKTCEHDVNITAETHETITEIHKVVDSEEKPVLVRRDRKPPMLGSLPKMPSKEREVSTAVVLIREGSSRTKTSASPAQEELHSPIQAAAASLSPEPPGSSGHSVSMLLKEKGYQADIGSVVGDNQNTAGDKGVPHKHVNCLEIPLQTITPPDAGWTESQRERTFSSSSATSGPSAVTDNTDTFTKTREDEGIDIKPTGKDTAKQKSFSPLRNTQEQTPPLTKQKDLGDFEAVKRIDPTFPPRSPAVRRFKPQPIEVKSLSKETQKQEMATNPAATNRPQTIEVKSIAKNSQKPAVPPKPSCKFKPADLGAEAQRSSVTTAKPQGEERSQTIVVSSPTIYRKISSESTSASNYSRKLAVSAVSSLKPPPNKTAATTISSLSNQSMEQSETEVTSDRTQQQQPTASSQSSRYAQQPATVPTSAPGSGVTSAPGPVSDPKPNQIPEPASAGVTQTSQPAAVHPDIQQECPRPTYPHEQTMPVTSNNTKQQVAVSTAQAPRYPCQPCHRSLSSERSQRTDDLRFYASDDPPSYDERESFSPLLLPDLTPLRSNHYQPSSRPPPCSCTAGCPSHPGVFPPHRHRSPHNLTPPAPPHSPGQTLPYPVQQPPLRPHQCRPEPQPMSYQPSSPKSNTLGPSQQPSMYQPLHQSAPCPPHPSLMQACPADRPLQPPQHIDPRRPPVHRSPHQQPPGMAGAPYSDPAHSHSPGLPPMDPQYLCGPQGMGPAYGSEYGGDSSSLYSESSYGQNPRRVLMDPETGKYFYIEVPVQPLRKMLFDPETGQYVEVLIPQQAMSHSGLYPPSAAPYPPLHNPNMYAPAPQYMPYAAPPPPAHPQPQSQPPRYPEASAAAAMHSSGPGVSYRNPSGQGSKPEPPNHPPLDHSYLESMYYVPTGMNASPNPTPPDYYHKHPPNLPPTGGKRS